MMPLSDLKTGNPSTSLEKGIAKEKTLERHLRFKHPEAEITRTPQTGDGGKDIILKESGATRFIEVKNWAGSMTEYDVRYYADKHENIQGDLQIYNEGGFSEGARRVAERHGIDLIDGDDYSPPRLRQVFVYLKIRGREISYELSQSVKRGFLRFTRRISDMISREKVCNLGKWLKLKLGKSVEGVLKNLTKEQLALFLVVLPPIWIVVRDKIEKKPRKFIVDAIIAALITWMVYALVREFLNN